MSLTMRHKDLSIRIMKKMLSSDIIILGTENT